MVIRIRSPLIRLCQSIRRVIDYTGRQHTNTGTGGVFKHKTLHTKTGSTSNGNYVFFIALPQVAGGPLLVNHVILRLDGTTSPKKLVSAHETGASRIELNYCRDESDKEYGKEKVPLRPGVELVVVTSPPVVKPENQQNSSNSNIMFPTQNKNKSPKSTSGGRDFKDIESLIDNWTEPVVPRRNRRKAAVKPVVGLDESDSYESCLNPFENEADEDGGGKDTDSNVKPAGPIDWTNPFEVDVIVEDDTEVNRVGTGNPFEEDLEESGDADTGDNSFLWRSSCERIERDKDESVGEAKSVESIPSVCVDTSQMNSDLIVENWREESDGQLNVEDVFVDVSASVDSDDEKDQSLEISKENKLTESHPAPPDPCPGWEDRTEADTDPRTDCHDGNAVGNDSSQNSIHNRHNGSCLSLTLRTHEGNIVDGSQNRLDPIETESISNKTPHTVFSELSLENDSDKNNENESTSDNSEDANYKKQTPEIHWEGDVPILNQFQSETKAITPKSSFLESTGDTKQATAGHGEGNGASQNAEENTDKENSSEHSMTSQRGFEKSSVHQYQMDGMPRSDKTLSASSADTTEGDDDRDVVLVTGGNGFLGQHIVKMLQLKAPHVKEIRVLDKVPFVQRLEYKATKPVKILTGNITDADLVTSSVKGVNSVLHIAGLVSFGTFPDIDGMKEVNVNGTLNIVNACLAEASVSRLIYCSTVDVVVGHDPIRGGNEDNTHVPNDFLFPGYPETKYQGERLVLGAARCARKRGHRLQTLALRANVMYGELDPYYVTSGLKMAKQRNGVLTQIGDGAAMFQQAYVGNTAWAFVCADCAIRSDPNLTSRFFYVPDSTPIQNSFNFMRPYLEARGFQLSSSPVSYNFVYGAITAAEKVAKLMSPLKRVNLPTQSCSIAYINMDLFFKGDKAKDVLKFEPLFSPVEARLLSMEYYNKVEL